MGTTGGADTPDGDPPAPDADDVDEDGPERRGFASYVNAGERRGFASNVSRPSRDRTPIEARARGVPGSMTRKKLYEWVIQQDPMLGPEGSSPLPANIQARDEWIELAFQVVKTKLLSHPAYGAGSGIPERVLTTSAEIFSCAEDIREAFLRPEYESLVVSDDARARRKKILNDFLAETVPKEEEEEERESGAGNDDHQLNVKLILTDIVETSRMRTFRSVLSPVLSKFGLLPELGMFHAALLIGPWLIDWNPSSFCAPRRVTKCQNVVAVVDMPPIKGRESVDSALNKIAIVLAHWNSRMVYIDRPRIRDAVWKGNCQDFVYDLLLELGFPATFPGLVGDFVKGLNTHGSSKLTYRPSPVVQRDFGLVASVTFNSHTELDQFVANKILAIEEFFGERAEYADDWILLKSFDRAFWLKYRQFLSMPTTAPGQPQGLALSRPRGDPRDSLGEGCPFKDPAETGSIVLTDMGLQG